MHILLSSFVLATNVLGPNLSVANYSVAVVGDEESSYRGGYLGKYSVETHQAVQEALKAKGYYSGAIDGKIGPATTDAFLRFRSEKGLVTCNRCYLDLDAGMIEALFGIAGFSVIRWDDEWCLLSKLGKAPGSNSAEACGAGAAESSAAEPEPEPVGALVQSAKKIPISCAAAVPECREAPPARQ